MAAKKCKNRAGKKVDCKRQRAGRKAAAARWGKTTRKPKATVSRTRRTAAIRHPSGEQMGSVSRSSGAYPWRSVSLAGQVSRHRTKANAVAAAKRRAGLRAPMEDDFDCGCG